MKLFLYIPIFALLVVLGVNIYIDPAYLLKKNAVESDEKTIANILLEGKHVLVPTEKIGFDERVSRKHLLEQKKTKDSSVIFGSSRVRYFSNVAFDDKTHFVDALNASTLEDLLVFTYLREKSNLTPKRLVIALDPWMIERKNSYTRLVQLAYPDVFINAVDFYQVTLPEKSQKMYRNLAGRVQKRVQVPFQHRIVRGDPTTDNFQEHIAGKAIVAGKAVLSFDAMIEEGTYYWAWRVTVNGVVKEFGDYMDSIQGTPAPHEYRTIVTTGFEVKEGDTIVLELAHANGDGQSVPRGNQKFHVENFSKNFLYDDPAAEKYKSFFEFLDFEEYETIALIGKELLSPAYFQESLKIIWTKESAEEGPLLLGKRECLPDLQYYVFCSDGSVPWPLPENHDVKSVDSIVRTVDDGLVPLVDVDKNALVLLRQITEQYMSKGTEIKFVLVPVHPYSYSKWASENDSRGFVKAEKVFKAFAKQHGVSIYGSYDPKVVGCGDADFRDWVHPLPACTNKLVNEILL